MFTDIDGWASLLWVILFFVVIFCVRSERQSRLQALILVCLAPAILVFMAVYASVRTEDGWCLFWGTAGIIVSAPVAVIALARMTAHYVSDHLNRGRQATSSNNSSEATSK